MQTHDPSKGARAARRHLTRARSKTMKDLAWHMSTSFSTTPLLDSSQRLQHSILLPRALMNSLLVGNPLMPWQTHREVWANRDEQGAPHEESSAPLSHAWLCQACQHQAAVNAPHGRRADIPTSSSLHSVLDIHGDLALFLLNQWWQTRHPPDRLHAFKLSLQAARVADAMAQ